MLMPVQMRMQKSRFPSTGGPVHFVLPVATFCTRRGAASLFVATTRIGYDNALCSFGSALMSCHSLAPPDGKPGPVLRFLGPGAKLKHRSPSMFKIVDYWSNV